MPFTHAGELCCATKHLHTEFNQCLRFPYGHNTGSLRTILALAVSGQGLSLSSTALQKAFV